MQNFTDILVEYGLKITGINRIQVVDGIIEEAKKEYEEYNQEDVLTIIFNRVFDIQIANPEQFIKKFDCAPYYKKQTNTFFKLFKMNLEEEKLRVVESKKINIEWLARNIAVDESIKKEDEKEYFIQKIFDAKKASEALAEKYMERAEQYRRQFTDMEEQKVFYQKIKKAVYPET